MDIKSSLIFVKVTSAVSLACVAVKHVVKEISDVVYNIGKDSVYENSINIKMIIEFIK